MSIYIVKIVYLLEKPKFLIIWNGGIICLSLFFILL